MILRGFGTVGIVFMGRFLVVVDFLGSITLSIGILTVHGSKMKVTVRAESGASPVGFVVFRAPVSQDFIGTSFLDGHWQRLRGIPRSRFIQVQHEDPGRGAGHEAVL